MIDANVAGPKQILIVEDERDIRESLKELLELEGYQVLTAENGREAYDQLKNNHQKSGNKPSLILLDLMMPVMNGWEFVSEISTHSALSSIPILAVTAFSDRINDISVKAVVKKPIDFDFMFQQIKKWSAV